MGGEQHGLRQSADVDIRPLETVPHAEGRRAAPVDADDDDGDRTLEHAWRYHSQETERAGILHRDEPMQSSVAGIRRPAGGFQHGLEPSTLDRLFGHRARHAARTDGVEHRVRHAVPVSRPRWATRCCATARHTASSFDAYPTGSAVLIAISGTCLSGPASNARVSDDT